ncbi:MAG: DNA repair protein RadA [Armatimonadetes bacterium]|nr:DNA repair protein RadA [Armatimonadota bacterium]
MPKTKTRYVCQECGSASPKWLGRCQDCGAWNSLHEEALPEARPSGSAFPPWEAPSITSVGPLEGQRLLTGIEALDAVLGGGLVPGSVALIGGDPGVGKSTLLTQAAGEMARAGRRVLYLSGEESSRQVKLRAERLGVVHENFLVAPATELEQALACIQGSSPDVAIVDSIQSLRSGNLESAAGSVGQVRYCASELQRAVKQSETALFLVGHVTKEGALAGPKVLEHLVDTVLYFEGEGHGRLRALRAAKNRFGPVDEVAVFEMTESGLKAVPNPSALLLAERQSDSPGTVVFPAVEGTRALLLEVQALVTPNYTHNPRRAVTGLDYNRVALVLGVMEKRCGMRLGNCDVFLNAVGGLQVREPAADLAIFLAVAGSLKDRPVPEDIVAFGEIGLTGEIRSVGGAELRLREAARLGFRRAAVSKGLKQAHAVAGLKVGAFRSVRDALALLGE